MDAKLVTEALTNDRLVFVIKGLKQRKGINYNDIFRPVPKIGTYLIPHILKYCYIGYQLCRKQSFQRKH